MELTIKNKKKNPLFKREEVFFITKDTASTPYRQEIRSLLSTKTGKKEENIAVINIFSEFGKNKAKGTAHIYKSKEELEKQEPKYVVKRNQKKPKEKEEKKEEETAPKTEEDKSSEEKEENKGDNK